ncbi:MAG: GNAT family N-acetyltransferase [Chloroflexi bacterium]|nr:MAG: GNAT family N-acetyltransferase [Chloroflexota bacterium]MBL1196638.1 GNAT family N-acetyltransferase [Chloroflexota bacterium]NOH13931.1 GNAT family N-acetyltransferase [Chloroflexota bacterium]
MTEHRPPPIATASEPVEGLLIRHLREADLPALEWEGQYTHFRNLYAEAYQRMQVGKAVLWVVEVPQIGLIGQAFIQLKINGRPRLADGWSRAYLHSFRVRPEYRGRGVGTRMMQVVEDDLQRRGFRNVLLNVTRDNQAAYDLYMRLNYQVVGEDEGKWSYVDQHGVVQHVHEPGWRLQKSLGVPSTQ